MPQVAGVDTANAENTNIAYLKRIDPGIEEVLATAGHVCLYYMTIDSQTWQRKNVEGSLFLLKRRSAPRFQLLVLNKMTTDNYTEEVHAGLDFECNPPYLMYTHGNAEILGVWFYEQSDLDKVESVLKRIKVCLPQPSTAAAAPSPHPCAAAIVPSAAATAHASGGDDFFDKPSMTNEAAAAALKQKQAAAQAQQQAPAPSAPVPTSAKALAAAQAQASLAQMHGGASSQQPKPEAPSSNLNQLFKNAQIKQQLQHGAPPAGTPAAAPPAGQVLLPPSFFSGQTAPSAVAQPNAGNKLLDQLRKGAALSPAPSSEVQGPGRPVEDAPSAAPGGNALAKLFAKAGASGHQPQQALPPATSNGGADVAGDREKVKALLSRMSTNVALLDMLASEMRAVGLM